MTIEEYRKLRENGEEIELITDKNNLSPEMAWTLELSYQCHILGLPLKEAISFIQSSKAVVIEGKIFDTFKKACDFFNTDSRYLYRKSKRTGIPKEDLLRKRVAQGIRGLRVSYHGEDYNSFSELCRSFNMDPRKVQSLANNRDISREQAFELSVKHKGNVPVNRKGKLVIVDGKEYVSKAAAYKSLSVPRNKINQLESKGHSFEEAVHIIKKVQK